MKGQLSAEMLLLITVILAIVAIAATQLIGTAKDTSGNIQKESERLNERVTESIKSQAGGYCFDDSDCQDGLTCSSGKKCG